MTGTTVLRQMGSRTAGSPALNLHGRKIHG
jgi:hypothetical protein